MLETAASARASRQALGEPLRLQARPKWRLIMLILACVMTALAAVLGRDLPQLIIRDVREGEWLGMAYAVAMFALVAWLSASFACLTLPGAVLLGADHHDVSFRRLLRTRRVAWAPIDEFHAVVRRQGSDWGVRIQVLGRTEAGQAIVLMTIPSIFTIPTDALIEELTARLTAARNTGNGFTPVPQSWLSRRRTLIWLVVAAQTLCTIGLLIALLTGALHR